MTATFKLYACIAFGAIIGFIVWNSHRIERKNEELCRTIAIMEQAGKDATAAAIKKEKEHAEKVKSLEARYSADLIALRQSNERLRQSRPSSGSALPGTPASTDGAPVLACFDRAEFVAATDGLLEEISPIAERGDEDALKLRYAIEYIRIAIKES